MSHAIWLYFRFPLSLRMVEEMLAARSIEVSLETVRQWALKFGQSFANQIRRRLPAAGDKWHLDEVVISIAGRKHWLWRAVDQHGVVLDILVQSRCNAMAAKRLLRSCSRSRAHASGDDHGQTGQLSCREEDGYVLASSIGNIKARTNRAENVISRLGDCERIMKASSQPDSLNVFSRCMTKSQISSAVPANTNASCSAPVPRSSLHGLGQGGRGNAMGF